MRFVFSRSSCVVVLMGERDLAEKRGLFGIFCGQVGKRTLGEWSRGGSAKRVLIGLKLMFTAAFGEQILANIHLVLIAQSTHITTPKEA